MTSSLGDKRKNDSDDELFSYGNTMELAFGKKMRHDNNRPRPVFNANDTKESDSDDSVTIDSDSCDETEKWQRNALSSEDENSRGHEDKLEDNDSYVMSPSPPPPPKLSGIELRRGKTGNSVSQLENILKTLKDEGSFSSPIIQGLSTRNEDLVLLDEAPKNREIMVKVSCHGIVNKYRFKQNEPFLQIQDGIAKKECTSKEKVLLTLNERLIKSSDTPESICYTVADIIECVILADVQNQPVADENNKDRINIQIQTCDSRSKQQFTIYKIERLEGIIAAYCKARNINMKGLKTYFDGDLVSMKQTPKELDMDNYDIVDLEHV